MITKINVKFAVAAIIFMVPKLTPVEFYSFRQIAFAFGITFMCSIANNIYTIEALSHKLEEIGY